MMRVNTLTNRYLFGELIPPFAITLVFFTFVFLMTRIMEITKLVVNYQVSVAVVGRMLLYTMPFFLQFVIPMSTMMAVLLAFLRLSSDNEIVALKAGGVSLYALMTPVIAFCMVTAGLTAAMAINGLPAGRMALRALALEVAATHADIGIKERTFNTQFRGVMLYVNRIDKAANQLIDVFIEDNRGEHLVTTVVAPRAQLFAQPEQQDYVLRLYNGSLHQVRLDQGQVNTVAFDAYDIRLNVLRALKASHHGPKDEEEMSLAELRAYLNTADPTTEQYRVSQMEFHKKFALPVSCLVLGLLGLPLGIQSRRAKRSTGIGVGLFFFLIYYLLLSAGWTFGETGAYAPRVGMWVPNAVMAAIAVPLMVLTARERRIPIGALWASARIAIRRRYTHRNTTRN